VALKRAQQRWLWVPLSAVGPSAQDPWQTLIANEIRGRDVHGTRRGIVVGVLQDEARSAMVFMERVRLGRNERQKGLYPITPSGFG
jgi:hypothetical protein